MDTRKAYSIIFLDHHFFFTAWVGSLCMSCASFFGPLAAKLCDRFGTRPVSICGALMCVISLLSSSRVSRLWILYITYSCLFGLGASCIHTAIFLVVSASFLKRRPLATGTLVAGHGAGIMIVHSGFYRFLLERLGWRKSFLVWAGVTLSICFIWLSVQQEPPKRTSK